jgi:polyphosphate:AMP phosphotransferase
MSLATTGGNVFETAELGIRIPKKEYREREPLLREELLDLQQQLREFKEFPVIIVFAGVDGAGKSKTVNLLNEWMDPRWLVTHAYDTPTQEESERPEFWRFWRDLPPKGQIGMYLSSWYSQPVCEYAYNKTDLPMFIDRLDRIARFENALAEDGAVILKFWMHLSRDAQKKRLKSLEKDPLTRWQVKERDWKHWGMYDQFVESAERTILRTSTGKAPWTVIEGEDENYRSLTVGTMIRDALAAKLDDSAAKRERMETLQREVPEGKTSAVNKCGDAGDGKSSAETSTASRPPLTILGTLDMSRSMKKTDYQQELKKYQAELSVLCRQALEQKISTVVLFEGPDAAGKGGAIRRITAPMQASNYRVIPIAAPTDEEAARHYLWRFWRQLPLAGRVQIFDRSWYGRELVERVEGFACEEEWKRAFAEINDFEDQLIDHGIVLVKFWIQISKEEQYARFKAREETPHKRWKLTEEDWRNRERWEDYELAVNDIIQHTSTVVAPWTLVEGDDKRYARIKVIRTLCQRLQEVLDSKSIKNNKKQNYKE